MGPAKELLGGVSRDLAASSMTIIATRFTTLFRFGCADERGAYIGFAGQRVPLRTWPANTRQGLRHFLCSRPWRD